MISIRGAIHESTLISEYPKEMIILVNRVRQKIGTERETERHRKRKKERDRQTEKETDRERKRETERQGERQTRIQRQNLIVHTWGLGNQRL